MLKVKDIAKQLGISSSTVSMVLNNRPGIGEETRTRVTQALTAAGYHIAPSGRVRHRDRGSLHFAVFRRHGHVVGNTPFFASLMEEIEGAAKRSGYHLLVSYHDYANPEPLILAEGTQGILLLATEMLPADAAPFLQAGLPVVTLDSALIGLHVDKVLIDNFEGAYNAVQYLYRRGHRRIGHLQSGYWIKNFDERRGGYQSALRDLGISAQDEYAVRLDSDTEGAYRDMLHFLRGAPKLPTAYFADNDDIAFGVLRALREMKIAVPEQVSIIGFDDVPFGAMTAPPLTTMRVDRSYIGKVAVERLCAIIDGESRYCLKQAVATTLLERESVADLPPGREKE